MKVLRIIGFFLVAMLVSTSFSGCEEDDEINGGSGKHDTPDPISIPSSITGKYIHLYRSDDQKLIINHLSATGAKITNQSFISYASGSAPTYKYRRGSGRTSAYDFEWTPLTYLAGTMTPSLRKYLEVTLTFNSNSTERGTFKGTMWTEGWKTGGEQYRKNETAVQGTFYLGGETDNGAGSSSGGSSSGGSSSGGSTGGSTTVSSATGTVQGHDYVDLGLSVKWATCNVGASKPEGYGNYYAWGETSTKSNYSTSTSTTYGKSISQLQSEGIIYGNNTLTANYDAATKNWGSRWRMPTKTEILELVNNCTTTWVTLNGIYGRKVTSKTNSNSIFLPAAGGRESTTPVNVGAVGCYWSSSPIESNNKGYYANLLGFNSVNIITSSLTGRYTGLSIRPVTD